MLGRLIVSRRSFQVSAGESHVKELQGQLEQLSHEHAASELDVLAASPIAPLYATITSLITALKVSFSRVFTR